MGIAALPCQEDDPKRVSMASLTGYAQTLRAIGQALETLNLGDFIIESDGEGYRVTGAMSMVKNARDPWRVGAPIGRATAMKLSYSRSVAEFHTSFLSGEPD